MRISYHCGLYILINLSNVQAFSSFTTTLSKSNTQLHVTESLVDAYQKKSPDLDITVGIVVPKVPTNGPAEVKDLSELASYLDRSVNDAKVAASQAASAASELAKQQPLFLKQQLASMDGKNIPLLKYFNTNIPPSEEGKVSTALDYLKTLNRQDQGVSSGVSKDTIGAMWANILEIKNTILVETEKAAATPQAIAFSSNLQQYFPWYVAAVTVLYSVNIKNNARADMSRKYKDELKMYKARADEAASAALQAAEGAQSVKDAVLASGTASINTLSSTVSKLQELQDEKDLTKKEIAKLIKDLQSLQQKFDVLLTEKEALEIKLSTPIAPVNEASISDEKKGSSEGINETEKKEKAKIVAQKKVDEKKLNAEAKKKTEEEIIAQKKSEEEKLKTEAKKKAEEDRLASETQKKAEKDKVVAKAQKKVEEDRLASEARKKAEKDKFVAETKKKAEEDKLASETKKKAEENRLASETQKIAEEILAIKDYAAKQAESSKAAKSSRVKKVPVKEEPKIETPVVTSQKEKITPKESKRRKPKVKQSVIIDGEPTIVVQELKSSTKKSTPKEKKEVLVVLEQNVNDPDENIAHPWSKLSQSTLSRKTVKELSTFLDERGATYADDKGKPLLKKLLVSTIREYF